MNIEKSKDSLVSNFSVGLLKEPLYLNFMLSANLDAKSSFAFSIDHTHQSHRLVIDLKNVILRPFASSRYFSDSAAYGQTISIIFGTKEMKYFKRSLRY